MGLKKVKIAIEAAVKVTYEGVNPPPIDIAVSPDGFGDFATTLPFRLAKTLHKAPIKIAQEIANNINSPYISDVKVAKPGYLNIYLSTLAYKEFLFELEKQGNQFFYEKPNNVKVQIEFVSANPTGPLHVGNGRGGIIGDVVGNLLKLRGFDVQKEYYLNDAGSKMELFTDSIAYYYMKLCGLKAEFPEDGYKGEYIKEIAEDAFSKFKDRYIKNGKADYEAIKDFGKDMMIWKIKSSLAKFGVMFDNWFYETSLYKSGEVDETTKIFKNSGYTYEKDGAVWFKSILFGDDKDRVLIRKTGEPTYTLVDAAYHRNKWQRGFKKVIDVWGADHFGHIIPMKALIQGMGIPKDFLDVIIYQIVHLYENGKEVMMSKHTGTFITLDELIEEVGKDAARFFFLLKSADTHLNFDMDLAKKESMDNPVYYVQYTYARLKNILRKAKGTNFSAGSMNISLLKEKEEKSLLNELLNLRNNLYSIADNNSVNKLPFLAIDISKKANGFYQKYKVIGSEFEKERLVLVNSSVSVLSLLMDLMGIEKREKM
ncbi:MAG: arginine--tRNA ligase [Nitrospiraceae bacterium]|nr:arginine--tRNA ligase [Nitrospiraceae bacterium]